MKLGMSYRGQIAVVMTFAIATLLGAMALGTDVAVMYFNWVQLRCRSAGRCVLSYPDKLDAISDRLGCGLGRRLWRSTRRRQQSGLHLRL